MITYALRSIPRSSTLMHSSSAVPIRGRCRYRAFISLPSPQRLGLRSISATFDVIAAPLLIMLVAGLTDHAHDVIDDFEEYLS